MEQTQLGSKDGHSDARPVFGLEPCVPFADTGEIDVRFILLRLSVLELLSRCSWFPYDVRSMPVWLNDVNESYNDLVLSSDSIFLKICLNLKKQQKIQWFI